MRKKKEIKNNELINYGDILTDKEILVYARILDAFAKKRINYQSLEKLFAENGVNVRPLLYDNSIYLTMADYNAAHERFARKEYVYSDIRSFILSNNEFQNIMFGLDYKSVEVLANSGDLEYKECLRIILKTFMKNIDVTSQKGLTLKRKWNTQIKELESELGMNSYKKSL